VCGIIKSPSQATIVRLTDVFWTRIHRGFYFFYIFLAQQPQLGQGLLIHEVYKSQRRTTVCRIPLDEWLARRRAHCLTTHNTHKRQTSIRNRNFNRLAAADLRLRPRGHWDRQNTSVTGHKSPTVWFPPSLAKPVRRLKSYLCVTNITFYRISQHWVSCGFACFVKFPHKNSSKFCPPLQLHLCRVVKYLTD